MSPANSRETYLLVAYDITDDKRRTRVARYLASRLLRRQKSLFEGWMPETLYHDFVNTLKERIDEDDDTVRIFRLPQSVRESVVLLGRELPLVKQDNRAII